MIKILDTTLRDGGYVNNWNFGVDKITSIIQRLILAKIDIIELGFLSNNLTNSNSTIYNSIEFAQKYIEKYNAENFCLMIKCGEFDITKLKSAKEVKLQQIRYIFKKNKQNLALKDCKEIIKKGYSLFINPVFIDDYQEDEFIDLLQKINSLRPKALSLVDSMGSLDEESVKKLYFNSNKILNKDITICLHFHNNTQRALKNTINIINLNKERNLIIDCSCKGMGRSAGNLCSEELASYLNHNHNKDYKISHIEDIIKNDINEFYKKNPWGNKKAYYICAKHHCHSNYADYLLKNKIKEEDFEKLLNQIPAEKKTTFDNNLIKDILSKTDTLQQLQQ